MRARLLASGRGFEGALAPPGDKSISHRAVLFALAARGRSRIRNLSTAEDVAASLRFAASLGASVELGEEVVIDSRGLGALAEPGSVIDVGNSGTLARLGLGVATMVPGLSIFSGDASVSRRPMARVIEPLRRMGALIEARGGVRLPMAVRGSRLSGQELSLVIASAQVKSAILLAGLGASGETRVTEPVLTRPHTEEFFAMTGIEFEEGYEGKRHFVALAGQQEPNTVDLEVPGDPSAAAFFIVGAACSPGSKVAVSGMYRGETRGRFLAVLERMGMSWDGSGAGATRALSGTDVEPAEVPSLIDELPALAVAFAAAEGRSSVSGAAELRVKESDRISAVVEMLGRFGVAVEESPDGFAVDGGLESVPRSRVVDSRLDHRIAMAGAILGCLAGGETVIEGVESVPTSYPGFFDDLARLAGASVELS